MLGIEFRRLEDALLLDTVRLLEPSEPIRLAAETMVHEATMEATMTPALRDSVLARRAAPTVRP